ncbi:MAG: hypothetical protein U1F33_04150 [Alphaproteobacteria bacterium]
MASKTMTETAGLTDEEVRLFILVANGMIRSSIWRGFYRFRGLNADFFDVYLADRPGDVVSIGVGPQRRFFALDHRDSSVRMGETLADVLGNVAFTPAGIA